MCLHTHTHTHTSAFSPVPQKDVIKLLWIFIARHLFSHGNINDTLTVGHRHTDTQTHTCTHAHRAPGCPISKGKHGERKQLQPNVLCRVSSACDGAVLFKVRSSLHMDWFTQFFLTFLPWHCLWLWGCMTVKWMIFELLLILHPFCPCNSFFFTPFHSRFIIGMTELLFLCATTKTSGVPHTH